MRLSAAYARFYKSFNFDQTRKLNRRVEKQPWEMFREQHFPYVTISIDPQITTVVGANESGKSHLLGVIKAAITGTGIRHRDLCRYSEFFGVAQGQSCWPHVGVGWDDLTHEEAEDIAELVGVGDADFKKFLMFREMPKQITLWLPDGENKWTPWKLDEAKTDRLEKLIPKPFEIDSDIALPNAIPFAFLAHGSDAPAVTIRGEYSGLAETLSELGSAVSAGVGQLQQEWPKLLPKLQPLLSPAAQELSDDELASLRLGRSLLLRLGDIDPTGLTQLADAIGEQQQGYVGGLLRAINSQLANRLNFKKYWVQDRDFNLRVTAREGELVFTISDRTGTEYTFSERSSGLRYFLSYLIQAQVHRPADARQSILLMDEPDTYLSAEAQQDLMRVFRDLADPPSGGDPIQVVYVTHSPFLLDKNHSERIRVLEKGVGYEGTRVVPSVSRNHYEPLRSAFGAFVGETAFVGSVNLLVEGPSDQILLAGAANAIRARSPRVADDTLDLNRLVIVPCGSAGEVPYTVFRVRGQGADKPPVVVLLDSDKSGREAATQLTTDSRLKKLIASEHVLALGKLSIDGVSEEAEIEDLLPTPLAHAAVKSVLDEVTKFRSGNAPRISLQSLQDARSGRPHLMDAVDEVAAKAKGRIDKLAFAKAVVRVCEGADKKLAPDVTLYLDRMRVIFRKANIAIRDAVQTAARRKLSSIVRERAELFGIDNPDHATREKGKIVLDEIDGQLDESVEAEAIRNEILLIRRDFLLQEQPGDPIDDYTAFLERLVGLRHAWDILVSSPSNSARDDD